MIKLEALIPLSDRKAYRAVARQVFDEEIQGSGSLISAEKRRFRSAARLHEQMSNGGVAQYLTNFGGADFSQAMGANQQMAILRR